MTLGGTQDHGTLLSSAGTSVWAKVLRGDGGFTAFDAEDPDVWYAEMQWRAGKGNSGPRKNGRLAVRRFSWTRSPCSRRSGSRTRVTSQAMESRAGSLLPGTRFPPGSSASVLDPGVYEDTITIRVQGRPALSGVIVDRFEVVEEIGVEEAVHHLLGLELLAPVQIGFLDWFGNGDGDFNAGDVLRRFDHCAAGGEGSGCAPASGTLAEPGQLLPGRQP